MLAANRGRFWTLGTVHSAGPGRTYPGRLAVQVGREQAAPGTGCAATASACAGAATGPDRGVRGLSGQRANHQQVLLVMWGDDERRHTGGVAHRGSAWQGRREHVPLVCDSEPAGPALLRPVRHTFDAGRRLKARFV